MKKKLFFIYHSIPSRFQGGSELIAYNLVKELSKKYEIELICFNLGGVQKKILNDFRKLKVKYIIKKINKEIVKITNFYPRDYLNKNIILKNQLFLKNKIKFKKTDRLLAMGNIAIASSKNILCKKIAIIEDPQPFVKIQREKFSINLTNFYKKIFKIIYLRFIYKNFWEWLSKITSNYDYICSLSKGDSLEIQNRINKKINFLRCPLKIEKVAKKKNKIFNIAMISYSITQDFEGIRILNKFLIPELKKKDLLKRINLYLIMNIFHNNIPSDIKEIINNKNIQIKNFDETGLIDKVDLLYYPSNFKVGVRSKILFSMSKKILVATNSSSKYGIPELSNKNCLIDEDNDLLSKKIISILKEKKLHKNLIDNAYNLIKYKYSPKNVIVKLEKLIN